MFAVGAAQYVLCAVCAHIFFFHAGKEPIKLAVKVLPVAVAQCQAHAKANDAPHLRLGAVVQNPRDIFLSIIDKWQNGAQPHNRWYARITQAQQHLEAFRCGGYVGLQLFAQPLIVCGQGYLHNALGSFIDLL